MNLDELIQQVTRLQQQVDSLVKPEVGRWISWTPVVTQGVVVTKTINYAKYIVKDGIVVLSCDLSMTSAGTAGNAIIISGIPIAPAHTGNFAVGSGNISVAGTNYVVGAWAAGANNFRFQGWTTTNYMGINPAITLANGSLLSFTATYEQA